MIEIKALNSSSKGNCYRISDGNAPILLECGLPYKTIQQALNFKMSEIKACLISHEHGDHSKSAKDILKAGIPIYTAEGTTEKLNLTHHRIKHVEAKKQFQVGTWTIMPFDLVHDAANHLGFLFVSQAGEKVVYITDSAYCKYNFPGVTHYMLEVNYDEETLENNFFEGRLNLALMKRIKKSHFSLENAVEFLKASDLSQVQEIWILHLSDSNSNEDKIKQTIQETTGKRVIITKG